MAYLKRHASSACYSIKRKENKFVIAPNPGGHNKDDSIPLQVILRDMLGYANTAREVKIILNRGDVEVNGQKRRTGKYPVGMMDIIHIPKTDDYFRLYPNKKKLKLLKISEKDAKTHILKVVGKVSVSEGKFQLRFHDGSTILYDKAVNVRDSAEIDIKSKKIAKILPLKKGASVLVSNGRNRGRSGVVKEIIAVPGGGRDRVIIEKVKDYNGDALKEEIETISDYVFVVG